MVVVLLIWHAVARLLSRAMDGTWRFRGENGPLHHLGALFICILSALVIGLGPAVIGALRAGR